MRPSRRRQPGVSCIGTRRWSQLRLAILTRDLWRCRYCGRFADQVDHVVPRALGGTDDPTNLAACCRRCNQSPQSRPTFFSDGAVTRRYSPQSLSPAVDFQPIVGDMTRGAVDP